MPHFFNERLIVMIIGNKNVNLERQVYLIAEIGSNHNQDKSLAMDMIYMAAESGADAVKFQSIDFNRLYQERYETHKFREEFRKIELNEDWYLDLSECASKVSVDFISAPTYIEAIDLLEECNVSVYKIASPQVQGNLDVVKKVAQTGKPMIMSLGYSGYADINRAICAAQDNNNNNIALLHCISKYPAKPKEANLRFIQTLNKMTNLPVGFSDHSLGDHVATAAVAVGACIIEKHVTIDRAMSGPDHHFAMTFSEFNIMEKKIRDITESLGDGTRLNLSNEENTHRKNVERKLFSSRIIKSGTQITQDDLILMRHSSDGISEENQKFIYKCVALNDIAKGVKLSWDQIQLKN